MEILDSCSNLCFEYSQQPQQDDGTIDYLLSLKLDYTILGMFKEFYIATLPELNRKRANLIKFLHQNGKSNLLPLLDNILV
jgi:hypothetical protein